ncbi:hypothetical protein ABEB36_006726 [Hypothenemus hampei]|uniref:HAT C-terminal dimerisation domain-containing protein n=1 Tax=Hypothenemus hampei TaxID=57062 RepID=A0ABD1ETS9_HYPHA
MVETRWISIEPAVQRILNQWDSLKVHFEIVRHTQNFYTAELLYAMYNDLSNKVYLTFLHTILDLIQKTNKSFESNSADVTKLYPNPYLGFAFENACREAGISNEAKNIIKSRCISFLIELSVQLRNRLPENLQILEKMNRFSVTECLKPNKMPITEIALEFFKDPLIISKIEMKWSRLHTVPWQEITNTEKFWGDVSHYKDASGENIFQELVDLSLRLLCLPHSNTDVKRIFSIMNVVKSNKRNVMKLLLLNNLLHIRFGLKRLDICCKDYQLPDTVLQLIGTKL